MSALRTNGTTVVSEDLYIQGDLQVVFDALYELGVIDPVLKMDWAAHLEAIGHNEFAIRRAVDLVNQSSHNPERLMETLKSLEPRTLELLAIEVAREYAGFHSRAVLH